MKYKHIQAAHELRMWVITVAMGVGLANEMLNKHPEAKEKIAQKINKVKSKFAKKAEPKHETITFVVVHEKDKES